MCPCIFEYVQICVHFQPSWQVTNSSFSFLGLTSPHPLPVLRLRAAGPSARSLIETALLLTSSSQSKEGSSYGRGSVACYTKFRPSLDVKSGLCIVNQTKTLQPHLPLRKKVWLWKRLFKGRQNSWEGFPKASWKPNCSLKNFDELSINESRNLWIKFPLKYTGFKN